VVAENMKTGARGLIIPAASGQLGSPTEDTLLPETVAGSRVLGSVGEPAVPERSVRTRRL
jgi:hypothetical protein